MGSVVFDARDVVLGRAAGVGVDPLGDAELGFGFVQALRRFRVFAFGAAVGEHVGLGFGERRERAARLAFLCRRLPVEAVGPLDHATGKRRALLLLERRLGSASALLALFRTRGAATAWHGRILRQNCRRWRKSARDSTATLTH